jgi:iron complex outermembrane receptor protein
MTMLAFARAAGAKSFLFAAAALLTAIAVPATAVASQADTVSVNGVVLDSRGEPVVGATVAFSGVIPVRTGAAGDFAISVPAGEREVRVTHADHVTLVRTITVTAVMEPLTLQFEQVLAVGETVTVIGIRADSAVPITTAELNRADLDRISYGQDVPKALQYEPSMTWYSDSGIGSNYSYFSLRGIQQSRINITYDGAPLNDPAEHALYFNNFHDFLSEVDSVQIQRGVGTSTVGTPAFGGSVNFASRPAPADAGLTGRLQWGSYDTARASLGAHTGRTASGWWASGRYSYANTDGYREHSGSEHGTFFLNGGWQGSDAELKFTGFAGNEQSQMAFLAVDPDTLAENRRFNPLDEEERDDFGQSFAQLRYLRDVGNDWLLTASAYYNGADGWFRLWDSPAQNDLLEFGIDQGFWGTMVTASRQAGALRSSFGAHYNDFSGDHTLDIGSDRIYRNTGFKKTASAFAKAEYATGDWLLFGDLNLRWAEFRYEGDVDLGSVSWTFLDPKVGARYTLTPEASLYASIGRAQREPGRLDLLQGEDNATVPHDLTAVRPEAVVNFEAGLNYATDRLTLQFNAYAMEFTDEIALTGELSEIGLPVRTNVDSSYRRGVELDLRWRPAAEWLLSGAVNLSRNRISEWTQYYDVYDSAGGYVGSEPLTYRDVAPLLTPEFVGTIGVEWSRGSVQLGLVGQYVAHSQLDNTGIADYRTPSFTNVDFLGSIGLGRWWSSGGPRLKAFVNNVFNTDQLPSGYSYQFINRDASGVDALDGIPFFYPRATRNVVLSLEFDF